MSQEPRITRHSATHRSIHTEIEIDAPAAVVWATLTDAATTPEWSSTFQGFAGELGPDASITLGVKAFGRIMSVDHTLAHYDEGRLLGWSERAMPGIVDNHQFIVEPSGPTTRFVQSDEFRGWGVPLYGWFNLRQVKRIYPTFNAELKAEAERRANQSN